MPRIMTTAAELHALQEIDLALDRATARLADIDSQSGETPELIDARETAAEKQTALTSLRSRQAELEWAVEEAREKASGVEKKLYSGTVASPKELSDLDADLKSLRNQLRSREDALLTHMVEIEDAESDLDRAQSELDQIEGAWRARQQEFDSERAEIEPEVERMKGRRVAETDGLDQATLALYEMLRQRRGGNAVAKLERGMCQGCRISLPSSVLQKARSGVGLVQCVSCERILWVN